MYVVPAASTFESLCGASQSPCLDFPAAGQGFQEYFDESTDVLSSYSVPDGATLPEFASPSFEASFQLMHLSLPFDISDSKAMSKDASGGLPTRMHGMAGTTGYSTYGNEVSDPVTASKTNYALDSEPHPTSSTHSEDASYANPDQSDTISIEVDAATSLAALAHGYHAAPTAGTAFASIRACAEWKAEVLSASLGTLCPMFSALDSVITYAKDARVRGYSIRGITMCCVC